ncbi:NAD(P)-dependent oxidoreductase [Piscinibacter sp. HJYY11]|uniref:NAD-dependent epimerase/dehydratase family protein n=1 Tax=Piscinibacter sp. HJYY11 TaxID=2801333 RepID=UPI00191FC8A9|nr:NAD(P)-dependent oxidoreductase [Piscinibacter sp. HJYY11]MBL0727218.1 NAD(P)-dependent oxidoreductase [Piscinibacter sp. HJYY11]
MTTPLPRVLMTGASGKLARSIRPYLVQYCSELRLADIVAPTAEHERETCHTADLAQLDGRDELFEGIHTIVHFAGYPREADWSTLMAPNVVGVANLWEMAHRHGVQRVVYASSNHAVGFYPRSHTIDGQVLPRPDTRYGVAKVFMEALASFYADKHGIRAFGLRIGHGSPEPTDRRMLSVWVHPEDLADLVRVGIQADYLCEIVYGASNNSRAWWDNRRAIELGYKPRHSADRFAAALESVHSQDAVTERYQGGAFAANGFVGDPLRPERDR